MNVTLLEPRHDMVPAVIDIFTRTITDTFKLNGIDDQASLLYEIHEKSERVKQYVHRKEKTDFFLIAQINTCMVGIAGFYPVSSLIQKNLSSVTPNDIEVGSVYIKPEYQKKGIAPILLSGLLAEMKHHRMKKFYLYCGYAESQGYWRKMFGDPKRILSDYFGKDEACMIWEIDTGEAVEKVSNRR